MKKNKNFLIVILALALSAALLVGCAPKQQAVTLPEVAPVAEESTSGGVLFLKVNPEIALHYDENGKVTKVEARNADARNLLKNFTGFEGKQAQEVLEELVQLIGNAGYLVEEAEGKARRIVLELDPGSQVPHEKFLEDMAAHVKQCVENTERTGEVEYDYDEAPVKTLSTETVPVVPEKPVNLCPSCGDDDCDDGEYCEDADELQENLREEQPKPTEPKPTEPKPTEPKPTKPTPTLCPICGDDDCDDGENCDDWDELEENLREQENREKGIRCPVCGDDDCDDGDDCDDWDERFEDDDDDDDDDDHHHGRHHDD